MDDLIELLQDCLEYVAASHDEHGHFIIPCGDDCSDIILMNRLEEKIANLKLERE